MIAAMTLSVGDLFAAYTIERLLGTGGMGEVYLVQHPRLPRKEALKILKADISSDESFRQRFIREADSIAALEHPNIVTVFDRGDTGGRLWIATQFVDGFDAARLLLDRYPAGMPAGEVSAITTAMAEALDYAHSKGLLHRDVKPANILLAHPDHDGNRRVYLADFGIARPLDDPAGLTATNFTLGTFAYAAPEQLMGKAIDGRADQYALAATAYHLLTGRPVYADSNPVAVISQHLTVPAPAPSTVRAGLTAFDGVFARGLAKNPEDRFPRCQDLAAALTSAAHNSGAGYSATAPTQQAPIPPPPSGDDIHKLFADNPERAEEFFRQVLPHRYAAPPIPTTTPRKKPWSVWFFMGLAAVAIFATLLDPPWKSSQEGSTPTSSELPTKAAMSPTPPAAAASTPTSATTSPTSSASSAPPTSVAPVSVPPTISKAGDYCPDSALAVQGIANSPLYAIGDQPKFTMVVTNIGLVACKRDVGAAVLAAYVYSLDNSRLWSNLDCAPSNETLVKTFNPGEQVTTAVTWTGMGSAPQCPLPREPIGTGTYNLVVQLGNLRAAAAPFIIASATGPGG
jgi:serine/threonine protein kinase